MIDPSTSSVLDTQSIVVRVYWDQCTSNFVVPDLNYSATDYEYSIDTSEIFITVPAWTSNYCDTWGRGMIALGDTATSEFNGAYPFIRLDNHLSRSDNSRQDKL